MQTVPAGRVAFLAHTPPLPPVSGERVRNWSLIRELARRGWEVSLFGLLQGDKPPSPADRAELSEICHEVVLEPLEVAKPVRMLRVARDLLIGRAFQSNFFYSRRTATACRSWLSEREFDLIVVETHYMVPYLPSELFRRAVFDSHNSEARRISSMAANLGLSPRGVAARLQRGAAVRLERRTVGRAARTLAVSAEDRAALEPFAPGRVDLVPNGVDCERLLARSSMPERANVLFLGSLDYSANIDALAYFVDSVAPRLLHRDSIFSVVGSHPRGEVYDIARRCPLATEVSGNVPDTTPYWQEARALVVPLRVGGGTRLKILEALARGVPVVTTSLGFEGLELEAGSDLLVADDPAELASCIDRLLSDDDLCEALAAHGRASVEARYDWRTIGGVLERSLLSAIGQA